MSDRPIIAIDVDDVLANSAESFRLQVNELTGASLTTEHYRVPGEYHHYFDRVWETHGIADKVPKDQLFQQMSQDQSHVLPYEGASQTLKQLAKNFRLVIVTARAPEWQLASRVWLQGHFPDVFEDIHFAGNRRDPSGKTKGDLCAEIGASYLIDDNPEHAQSAAEKGVTAILFGEYGWHVDIPTNVAQCKTWKDVEEYFDRAQRH